MSNRSENVVLIPLYHRWIHTSNLSAKEQREHTRHLKKLLGWLAGDPHILYEEEPGKREGQFLLEKSLRITCSIDTGATVFVALIGARDLYGLIDFRKRCEHQVPALRQAIWTIYDELTVALINNLRPVGNADDLLTRAPVFTTKDGDTFLILTRMCEDPVQVKESLARLEQQLATTRETLPPTPPQPPLTKESTRKTRPGSPLLTSKAFRSSRPGPPSGGNHGKR